MLKYLISISITCIFLNAFGQQPTLQQKLQSNLNLNTQFQVLLNQSKSQDVDFKIIRKSNIEIIQQNVSDSISKYTKEIASLKSSSSSSGTTIQSLRDSVQTLDASLTQERSKTDSISFLGIDFSKPTYHTIVWSIIIILALILFIVLISFRKAKVDAMQQQESADQAQNELASFKKKAMETEQKLKRQLLDEQLKNNE